MDYLTKGIVYKTVIYDAVDDEGDAVRVYESIPQLPPNAPAGHPAIMEPTRYWAREPFDHEVPPGVLIQPDGSTQSGLILPKSNGQLRGPQKTEHRAKGITHFEIPAANVHEAIAKFDDCYAAAVKRAVQVYVQRYNEEMLRRATRSH